MRDCQKKIDILISGLIEFKEEEAAQYDRKIRQLELEKEYNKQMFYKDQNYYKLLMHQEINYEEYGIWNDEIATA